MSGSRKMVLGFVAAASMVVAPLLVAAPASAATDYANCTELRADYPHGVGEPGAVDSTSSTPVTNFTVDQALYDANSESDRDGDGIACEKH
ncbi:excalibur calcium-binding domain-containing protein [Gordonia westfalica]|uniref:Excalibur calcium-binding domain-containing protein n=1 Tax=Gordonia westfalica TaxID=158898 RepID=A0A1H2JVR4_9ACTN|nr:excalibur calcium-binding domain-containing protein [Gordonia westfalica]SDU60490.1 Excalibur calcium-binding domain-containing protein [Gordonia westfalica]